MNTPIAPKPLIILHDTPHIFLLMTAHRTAAASPYTQASRNPQTSWAPHNYARHRRAPRRVLGARAGRRAVRCIPCGRRYRIQGSVRRGGRVTSGVGEGQWVVRVG